MTGALANVGRAVGLFLDRGLGWEGEMVRGYWRGQREVELEPPPDLEGVVLSSAATGLGDTIMLGDVMRASEGEVQAWSNSGHFRPLMKLNPWWKAEAFDKAVLMANAPNLVRYRATGNGHYLQRLRRAYGLGVDPVPRGCVMWRGKRARNRVVMHFEAGAHALWQRQNVHPKARQLYPGSREALVEWIKSEPGLEVWTVGREQPLAGVRGVQHKRTPTIRELVEVVGQCGLFVGIVSGVMHLATALKVPCVVLVNFPQAGQVCLPTLRHTHQIEAEWLYPQNVHLHQEEGSRLVPKVSAKTLAQARAGEVYPYWDTRWCPMVEEEVP